MNADEDGTIRADRELLRCKSVSPISDVMPQIGARDAMNPLRGHRCQRSRCSDVQALYRSGAPQAVWLALVVAAGINAVYGNLRVVAKRRQIERAFFA